MTTDQINIDDLRERAKTMHARALMHHYGVTGGKMHRMLKKYGIKAATYVRRSEEHTSELQSLMRISYDVFCLKKKKIYKQNTKPKQIPTQQHQNKTSANSRS